MEGNEKCWTLIQSNIRPDNLSFLQHLIITTIGQMSRRAASLKRESEDITNSLNAFFAERQAAIDAQNLAMDNYDLEMLAIGDVAEEDE